MARVYEQVVREGYGTPFIYKKLANTYYFKSKYRKARLWYEKLFKAEKNTDPEIAHRYKQTLKAIAVEESEKAVVKL